MMNLRKWLSNNLVLSSFNGIYRNYFQARRYKFGFIDQSARIRFPIVIKGIENVYMYENTHILGRSLIITTKAKFIMKKNSASAEGLTIVTGSHPQHVGEFFLQKAMEDEQDAKDIIIHEDVWISTNVTILSGVNIGRGSIIGSGSVCRDTIPPYSIVVGNPAKIVGFKFTPEEIVKHEKLLYTEDERLDIEYLNKNYYKYFINRISEIKSFVKL